MVRFSLSSALSFFFRFPVLSLFTVSIFKISPLRYVKQGIRLCVPDALHVSVVALASESYGYFVVKTMRKI